MADIAEVAEDQLPTSMGFMPPCCTPKVILGKQIRTEALPAKTEDDVLWIRSTPPSSERALPSTRRDDDDLKTIGEQLKIITEQLKLQTCSLQDLKTSLGSQEEVLCCEHVLQKVDDILKQQTAFIETRVGCVPEQITQVSDQLTSLLSQSVQKGADVSTHCPPVPSSPSNIQRDKLSEDTSQSLPKEITVTLSGPDESTNVSSGAEEAIKKKKGSSKRKSIKKDDENESATKKQASDEDVGAETTKTSVIQKLKTNSDEKFDRDSYQSFFRYAVSSTYFQLFSSFLIGSNTLFILIQTEQAAANLDRQVPPVTIQIIDCVFCLLFIIELGLRISAERMTFCRGKDKYWNIFDAVLVALQVQDQIAVIIVLAENTESQQSSGNSFDVLRTVRLLRVLRMVRLFRKFSKLTVMLNEIIGSMSALFWLFMLLGTFLLMLGLVFMIASLDVMRSTDDAQHELRTDLKRWFGSLPAALLSLFKAITGGIEWEAIGDRLMEISIIYGLLFLAFQGFALFGILNVATGVFCASAINSTKSQATALQQAKFIELKNLLSDISIYEHDTISTSVFARFLQNPNVKGFWKSLEMQTEDIRRIFDLLNMHGSGVQAEKFLKIVFQMLGAPQASSIIYLELEHCKLSKRISDLLDQRPSRRNSFSGFQDKSPRSGLEKKRRNSFSG